MATKVTIDGKTYCVETLLSEVKRLTKELTLQAEVNKQSKIGILTEIQLEIEEKSIIDYDEDLYDGGECIISISEINEIIQQKIDKLKE